MNLLEATALLIEFAKLRGDHDRELMRAARRMEKRLAVLQLRAAKAYKRRRSIAWKALQHFNTQCLHCDHAFSFGEFVSRAEINHRGWIKHFDCPNCLKPVIFLEGDAKCSRYVTQEMMREAEQSEVRLQAEVPW